jgi:hypothetical protein
MTIALGSLIAVEGLFSSFVGAIPGIISILAGYYLFKTGKHARKISNNDRFDSYSVEPIFQNLGYFLQITGILFIIALVLYTYFFISLL